ncbi:MAG: AAA family ATPase [Nitrosomonadales bacterium]|nr:AAA family ATPase [Nitrosomonadales bacterium]
MLTILIINSKGGAGKTTLCTNLASYYASKKFRTTIMDYDPQGSCLQWLRTRPDHMKNIHGANAAPPKGASTLHNLQKWVPVGTEVLIIDAPSGVKGLLLQEMVRRSNFIVVPVVPSPIDIHATDEFIKELFTIGGASSTRVKVAVVANRVRRSSPVRESLERFFSTLKLPFLTSISDSDNYLRAVEKGLGVFEMEEADSEREELLPILKWLDGNAYNRRAADREGNVVNMDDSRRAAANQVMGKLRHTPMRRKMDRA